MKKNIIAILMLVLLLSISFNSAGAANLKDAFGGGYLDTAAGDEGAGYNTSNISLDDNVGVIIKSALSFLGVIFLILMIYGGFLWMTASGKEEQVSKAKSIITAAIIGLIIVISAYAISYFVIKKLTSQTLVETAESTE